MEHPVNPDGSVLQAVLQPYQRDSLSSSSADGQGGQRALLYPSERGYPPAQSIVLRRRKSVELKTPAKKEPCRNLRKKTSGFACAVSASPP